MAAPDVQQLDPILGHTRGAEPIRIFGSNFAAAVEVRFGDQRAAVQGVLDTPTGDQVIHVLTPKHPERVVDVTVINLDGDERPISGERTTVSSGFRFMRTPISGESTLTRIIRAFISALQHQFKGFVSAPVSTQWGETHWIDGELQIITNAKTPSLIVEGPMLRPNSNPALSTAVRVERLVQGPSGEIVREYGWPLIHDLELVLGGTSKSTVQLLNMEHALLSYFKANPLLVIPADVDRGLPALRYQQRVSSNLATELVGTDNLRTFVVNARIVGVVLDQGVPTSTTGALDGAPDVSVQPHQSTTEPNS